MVRGLLWVGIHATALLAAPTANVENAQAAEDWRNGWPRPASSSDLQKSNVWGESPSSGGRGGFSLSSLFGGGRPSGSSSGLSGLWAGYRNKPSSSSQSFRPKPAMAPKPEAEAVEAESAAPASAGSELAPAEAQETTKPQEAAAPAKPQEAAAPAKPQGAAAPAKEQAPAANASSNAAESIAAPEAESIQEAKSTPAEASVEDHKAAPQAEAANDSSSVSAVPASAEVQKAPESAKAPETAETEAAPEKPASSFSLGGWGKSPLSSAWEFSSPASPKSSGRPKWGSGSGLSGIFGGYKPSSGSSSGSSPWSGMFGGYKPSSGSSGSSPFGSSYGSRPKPEPKPEPAEPKPETPKPESPKPEPEVAKPEPEAPKEVESPISPSIPNKPSPGGSDSAGRRTSVWQPKAGQKWQIVLDGVPDTRAKPFKPDDAPIWDIDLWDAKRSDIDGLHNMGKKVICYFSAGTSESWRPDYAQMKPYNLGKICKDDKCQSFWGGEEWVDPKSKVVWDVMKARIKMAADKGCDGIDPDNMDFYDNTIKGSNGKITKLSDSESVRYLKFMADEAARYNMSTGLKNSLSILPKVQNFIQFAVNEECVKNKECGGYGSFLAKGKPVFHIEYTNAAKSNNRVVYKDTKASTKKFCNPGGSNKFSTIIKPGNSLSPSFLYCDGKPGDETPTVKGSNGKASHRVNIVDAEEGEMEDEITESPEDGTAMENRVDDVTILADVGGVNGNESMIVKRSVPMLYRRHLDY